MREQAVVQTQKQAKTTSPVAGGFLQRRCACSQHTVAGGECAECRKKRLGLQRRAVDQAESTTMPPVMHEVLRSPEQPSDSAAHSFMESRFGHDFSMVNFNPADAAHSLLESRGGRPLDKPTRAFMESRFDHDFSHVRIHTDSRAAESAQVADARAYTVGRHIVFGPGQYAPGSRAGLELMVHELVHVIQQDASDAPRAHSPADFDRLDNEADQIAHVIIEQPENQPVSSSLSVESQERSASMDRGISFKHLSPLTTHPGVLFHDTGRRRGEDLADCINRHLGEHGIITHIGWIVIGLCGIVAALAGVVGAEAGVIPPAVGAAALCMAAATGVEIGVLAHCIWDCR